MRRRIPVLGRYDADIAKMLIGYFGSGIRAAKALDLDEGALRMRRKRGHPIVTAEEAVFLEELTEGELPRWELRPDLWDEPGKKPRKVDLGPRFSGLF